MFIKTLFSHPLTQSVLGLSIFQLLLAAGALYSVIKLLIVLYRLSPVHPLAKVPGPRIAAATKWYRTYYEAGPRAGRMRYELERLHQKYG